MGSLIHFLFLFIAFASFAQNENQLLHIKGGNITIGNTEQSDGQPVFKTKVNDFWMQQTEVTNAQFSAFVQKSGYITLAEKNKGSYVFHSNATIDSFSLADAPWWKFEQGVNWKHPDGINSSLLGKENHPVVHIAWEDAKCYCESLGMRLPTEVEYEYAATNNENSGTMNTWQGTFPDTNLLVDGYATTSPVASFKAGKIGLFDLQGNVWEWCWDPYHQNAYQYAKQWKVDSSQPLVPSYFDEFSPTEETRVIRGGSFLCSDGFCRGFEPSTRMRSSTKQTFQHIGFRCVKQR